MRVIRRRLTQQPQGEERDIESLPRLKEPIRIVINDPEFPLSLLIKNHNGDLIQSRAASKDMYRISNTISNRIRFLPVSGVNLDIELHDKTKLKDYAMFIDVVIRVLYRACLIECITSYSIESVNVRYVDSDRRKVVINVNPAKTQKEVETVRPDNEQVLDS